jgi:hypothetical protein
MVHIEKVEKIQHLIESDPISLNIFGRGPVLFDQRSDYGKNGKQNEERNGEFERTKKINNDREESLFFTFNPIL